MDLQTIRELYIDFSAQKYISLNMKQYDRSSRFILVTCCNQGELVYLDNNTCFAAVRYKKPDNKFAFNTCKITDNGKVLIEITEQMLSISGISYVDLVIYETSNVAVEISEANEENTPEIIDTGTGSILSTMTFCINIQESTVNNEDIESSYEYNALNDLIIESRRNYDNVIIACDDYKDKAETAATNAKISEDNVTALAISTQSYAVGDTGTREGEETDNAAYYWGKTKIALQDTLTFRGQAETSATNAANSATLAQSYAVGGTGTRETEEIDNAFYCYDKAKQFMRDAKSYAIGGYNSGTTDRPNDDIDNARYYYNQLKDVIDGLSNIFIPMGTVEFSELATVQKDTGYLYNVSDDFTTDSTFKCGAGFQFSAGTNVFYTADGYWSCLSGADSPSVLTTDVATLAEVTEYLNI